MATPPACRIAVHPIALAVAALFPAAALAQAAPQAGEGEEVVVSATRIEEKRFDLPLSIDAVGKARIQEGQAMVNLSESLARVPGIVVNNRQNYAQDLQISSRGFGGRASFGVRGVRLVADGIPATMPDGQGQASTFSLGSASRIEVLRGPFASLYGNSSGGVVQVFTEDGPKEPGGRLSVSAGSYDAWRVGLKAGGQSGAMNWLVDASRFDTNGYRDRSAARRDQLNAKLKFALGADTTLSVIGNALDQPNTLDPLGLTRAQFESNPRQVATVAETFNTRKSVRQNQGGLVVDHKLGGADKLRATVYSGHREVVQYLPQAGSIGLSAGGVVNLDRDYGGAGVRWTHTGTLAGAPANFSLGADFDSMKERRSGFVNNNGIPGALRRSEDDKVTNTDVYALGEWQFAPRWQANAGVRNSRVKFTSRDYFITAANPDDSGGVSYSDTTGAAGLLFKLTDRINLYGNLGTGFETPTFAELAYRPGGATGLNFGLKPSKSKQAEVGAKAYIGANQRINAALFRIDTRDEIVVDAAVGGRTTFKNASRTRRNGLELSWEADLAPGLQTYLAYTLVDATFRDTFTAGSGATVNAGSKLPGVPRAAVHGEVSWRHGSGFNAAAEVHHGGRVYVDDANSDAAAGWTIANLRVGYEHALGRWKLVEFLRVDNVFDKKYAGSVIVADSNGRYFEPAPGRNWLLGVSAQFKF